MSLDPLMDRIERGETAALGALYDEIGGYLFRLALRIVGNRRNAEKIVEDVFQNVWRDGRDFQPRPAGTLTWLVAMTRMNALKLAREASRRIPQKATAAITDRTSGQAAISPPSSMASTGRCVRPMETWMREAGPGEFNALEMVYFTGGTYHEAATCLDEAPGTVASRIGQGMEILRQKMKEPDHVPLTPSTNAPGSDPSSTTVRPATLST